VLEKALLGFNATVFAYGQTGSGKTFTMEGGVGGDNVSNSSGIIPRLGAALFNAAASGRRSGSKNLESLEVKAEFIEIYNERVIDLLKDGDEDGVGGDEGSLHIRQTALGEIFVEDATSRTCSTLTSLLGLLAEGSARRARGETNMNAASSRSHAVLTLHLVTVWGGVARTSKLHLIDLAGSERADATGARGERLREGAQINKSLSALGGVISALTTPGRTHIPYRDSKLTRLLTDSLGGNAITVMLCCVSPALQSLDETLSALRFAERAKKVRNVAKINIDPVAAKMAALEALTGALKERLGHLECALARRLGFGWSVTAAVKSGDTGGANAEAKQAVEGEVMRTKEDLRRSRDGEIGKELPPFRHAADERGGPAGSCEISSGGHLDHHSIPLPSCGSGGTPLHFHQIPSSSASQPPPLGWESGKSQKLGRREASSAWSRRCCSIA